MNDLLCVIPLYGNDCERVSLRMVSSLAIQETKYDVTYLFIYDDTVSLDALINIKLLLRNSKIKFVMMKSDKQRSGYKRNKGIRYASENGFNYIWFLDQDDYIIKDNVFDPILYFLYHNNAEVLRIGFELPDTIDEQNKKNLMITVTMPWLYIIKVELIKDYRFNEEHEYGSDVPYTIRFLANRGYIKILPDAKLRIVKEIYTSVISLYYYNYLNDNSYMGKHFHMEGSEKQEEVDYAINEILKVKTEAESKEVNIR